MTFFERLKVGLEEGIAHAKGEISLKTTESVTMKIVVDNKENLEVEDQSFTCLVHQQGMRVELPEAKEINSRQTIDCVEKLNQKQWDHIRTGQLFRMLFSTVFPKSDFEEQFGKTYKNLPEDKLLIKVPRNEELNPSYGSKEKEIEWNIDLEPGIPISENVEDLKKSDYGVMHITGLIILACEELIQGNTKIFLRTPEDHLHPKTQQRIVDMIHKMMYLFGGNGGVATEEKA